MSTLESTVFKDDNKIYREYKLFMSAAVLENKLYFSDQVRNGLYYYDLNLGETNLVAHFKNEAMTKLDLHRKVIRDGSSLLFMPYYGRNIHILDKEDDSIKSIKIYEAKDNRQHFSNAIKKDNKVLIIPFFLDIPLIEFDLKTGSYEKNNWIIDKISAELSKVDKTKAEKYNYFDIYNSCLCNGKLILSIIGLNMLFIYDVAEEKFETIRLDEDTQIRSINEIDGYIYITLLNSRNIIKYDLQKREERTFKCNDLSTKLAPFTQVAKIGNEIVALAGYMDDCYVLDDKTGEMTLNEVLRECAIRITDDFALLGDLVVDECNRTYICPRATKKVVLFDGSLDNCETIDVIFDQGKSLSDVMGGYIKDDGLIKEDSLLSLKPFIEYVKGV